MPSPLRIVWISAKNFMGLSDATLQVGDGVEVHGDNGSGKTSLLNALRSIVQARGTHDLIKVGEHRGQILAHLEGEGGQSYEVQRTLGSQAKVKRRLTEDGRPVSVKKPQAWLESVFGELAFDPLAFSESGAKGQLEMFCRAFPCTLRGIADEDAAMWDIDLDQNGFVALNQLEEAIEHDRREIGRDARRKKAAAEEAKPEGEPVQYDKDAHQKAKEALAVAERDLATVDQQNEEIERHNAAIERACEEIEECERRLEEAQARLKSLGEPRDPIAMEAKEGAVSRAKDALSGHEEEHQACLAWNRYMDMDAQARGSQLIYDDRTTKLETLRTTWTQKLTKQIECPIEGLAVTHTGLEVQGVPLASVNHAERLRIGVEIAAALQREKSVRIVCIDNAESLTPHNRAALAEHAEKLGLQWVFLVASEAGQVPEGAAVIEGGRIVGDESEDEPEDVPAAQQESAADLPF